MATATSPYGETSPNGLNRTPKQVGNRSFDENEPTQRLNQSTIDQHIPSSDNTRLSMPEPKVRQNMKAGTTGMTHISATTSQIVREEKQLQERHRKTMLKVMDPNVHQLSLSRNKSGLDNSDDEMDHHSNITGSRTVVVRGMEPKIEMKRKLARQSDLILSLEKTDVRKSTEVNKLKRRIEDQDKIIEDLKQSKPQVVINSPPEIVKEKAEQLVQTEPEKVQEKIAELSESELEEDVKMGRVQRGQKDKWNMNDSHSFYDVLVRDRSQNRLGSKSQLLEVKATESLKALEVDAGQQRDSSKLDNKQEADKIDEKQLAVRNKSFKRLPKSSSRLM